MSKKFAVFDIDGTIFRWQLYHELFDELYRSNVLSDEDVAPVFAARDAWRDRKAGFDAYEMTLVRTMEERIVGVKESVLTTAADTIIALRGHHTYRYTTQLIDELKSQGYSILAISGSQQQIVERFATHHGIDIARGRQHEIKDGIITDIVKPVYGHKAEILHELVETHHLSWDDSYAVGDTGSDRDILELVTHPIAFNPDEKLFSRARKEGWTIVVERKNMIYRLEPHGNTFVLA